MTRAARLPLLLALLAACSSGPGQPTVLMRFDRADGSFSAPFPSEDLRRGEPLFAERFFPRAHEDRLAGRGRCL